MSIAIVPKRELSDTIICKVGARVVAVEHKYDKGPCVSWDNKNLISYLYVPILHLTNEPIGILFADGPLNSIVPGWWLDSKYRGAGYASKMVCAFADYLKSKGVTSAGRIPIDTFGGRYHDASCALAKKFKLQLRATK